MKPFFVLGAALFALSTAAHAVQDCEMNGQHVNPANGSTTAGKSGIMKCRDRDSGKLVRETEYQSGRAVGYRKSIDLNGAVSVGSYNEKGNREGEFKQYDPAGKLLSEERYVNSDLIGVQTYYYPSGQLKRRSIHEPRKGALASLEYNDRGQLTDLRCADKPLLGDDRALCGFDGKASEVTLYNSRGEVSGKMRYEGGRRTAVASLGSSGAVVRSDEVAGDRRVTRSNFPDGQLRLETVVVGSYKQSERELSRSGQPVRDTQWQQGRKSEETFWYMNGQLRSKTRWTSEDNYVEQLFDDAGLLRSEGIYEKNRITRRKTYKDGKLATDEELFEDGSRKSLRKVE